jgi:hypothetical protein
VSRRIQQDDAAVAEEVEVVADLDPVEQTGGQQVLDPEEPGRRVIVGLQRECHFAGAHRACRILEVIQTACVVEVKV